MDARIPERYLPFVEPVDILIQDIAQRDQVEIVVKNLCMLKKGGNLILFLKMLSMGVLKEYEEIIDLSIILLKKAGITNMQVIQLEKYHAGHVAITGVYYPKQ